MGTPQAQIPISVIAWLIFFQTKLINLNFLEKHENRPRFTSTEAYFLRQPRPIFYVQNAALIIRVISTVLEPPYRHSASFAVSLRDNELELEALVPKTFIENMNRNVITLS